MSAVQAKIKLSTIEKWKRKREKYKERLLAKKRRLTEAEDYMSRDYNSIK